MTTADDPPVKDNTLFFLLVAVIVSCHFTCVGLASSKMI